MKRMNSGLVAAFVIVAIAALIGTNEACSINPCGAGEVVCGNGCMPDGAACCDSAGDYCTDGRVCAPGPTCVGSAPSNPCDGCLLQGEECCNNYDGIIDCAPLGASCCGDHRYCPSGYVCGGTCGSACCP